MVAVADPDFVARQVMSALLTLTKTATGQPRRITSVGRLPLTIILPRPHASLGYQLMCDYVCVESDRELKRAMELNPNYARENLLRWRWVGYFSREY